MKRKILLALLAFIILSSILYVSLPKDLEAPDFTLNVITEKGLTEEKVTLSNFKGKVIFLDFVMAWCPHCNNMASTIKALYENFSNKGVIFITVAGGDKVATPELTSKFVRDHEISWKVLYDYNLSVFKAYNIEGTPTYIILDKSGKIFWKGIGEKSYEELAKEIEKALS
ncbi:Thiol-disulfide oxidoreductase ResA [archaeon HR06]|nr:Thiol-disulfide oxidoreductase ResA [archaeon HR06]